MGMLLRASKLGCKLLAVIALVMGASVAVIGAASSVSGANAPQLTFGYNSDAEAYIFPGDNGMSEQTTTVYYCLVFSANVTITVLNSHGTVVRTLQQGVSEQGNGGPCGTSYPNQSILWDGTNDSSQLVAPGQYTVRIAATNQDGSTSISTVRDVASTNPGQLTTPSSGGTVNASSGFVFTPNSSFTSTFTINQVAVNCFNAATTASGNGSWKASAEPGQCDDGATSLTPTVDFTDPVGGTHTWTDPTSTSVTIVGSNAPQLIFSEHSDAEGYIFPGVAGMSDQSTTIYYCQVWSANVTITVLNSHGTLVRTLQPSTAQQGVDGSGGSTCPYYDPNESITWDGTNDSNQLVAPGAYTVHIAAASTDGTTSIDTVRDVASVTPGQLTTPTAGATINGTTGFVFTPNSNFTSNFTISQVDVNCFDTATTASGNGTWKGSGDASLCTDGATSLTPTVDFTDPLGGGHTWTDPTSTSVTITGSNPPQLKFLNNADAEAYIFPGDAGMSDQTTTIDYCLVWSANVTVTVLNSHGTVVRTLQPSTAEQGIDGSGGSTCAYYAPNESISWDGTNDSSQVVAPGQYTVRIAATNGDGNATITTVRDVASVAAVGQLTSPSSGATVNSTTGFVFTPNSSFASNFTINQVDVNCFNAATTASGNGTWKGSAEPGQCDDGATSLTPVVNFSDQLGGTHSWTDPTSTSVTVTGSNSPQLNFSYGSDGEAYIFPGDAGMSDQTTTAYYCLVWTANVTITVLNSHGTVVRTLQPSTAEQGLDGSDGNTCTYDNPNESITWDGTSDSSQVVAPGQYTIHIAAKNPDGSTSIDTVRDVATGNPGQLTTPSAGGTMSGLAQLAFTPDNSFFSGGSIGQVQMCLSTGGCADSYNLSPDGNWETTELTGDLTEGPATLSTEVYFTDPLGNSETWTDAGTPVSVNTTAVPLQASLNPTQGPAPFQTSLSVTTSDPNGLPLSYTVDFGDGTSPVTGTIDYPYNPIALPHTFEQAGSYQVHVSVDDGGSGSANTEVTAVATSAAGLAVQLAPSPASGPAPLTSALTVTTSDPNNQPVSYSLAFGDGQNTTGTIAAPYAPVTINHTYAEPGTYSAGVSVSDQSGTTGSAIESIQATGTVPLVANAGENQDTVVNDSVTFDGSGSTPASSITSYAWTFGDGTTGSGEFASHAYTAPGTYTATLTVKTKQTTATAQTQVAVAAAPGAGKGLTVSVTDGSSALPNVSLAVITADGDRATATTNAQGVGVIEGLPDGSYSVDAYGANYLPGVGQATQTNGSGSTTLTLQPGSVGQTSATSSVLDKQQIEAAGLDPNDPANQNVFKFTINLAFTAGSSTDPVQIVGDLNGNGVWEPEVTGGTAEACNDCVGFDVGGYQVVGQAIETSDNQPALMWMVIPGQAQWLKEFFDVKTMVSNLASSSFSFDSGTITLGNLPDGLSLAPTAAAQSMTQSVPSIPGGQSATEDWVLRGDEEGYYGITANYTGTLDPGQFPLSLPIATAPGSIHVWGGSAVQMIVDTDDQATYGSPYLVRVGLENVADVPVYDAGVELKTDGAVNYIYQPGQQLGYSTAVIEPGATFWTDYYRLVPAIPGGNLDLSQSFVKQTGGNVDLTSTIESHPAQTGVPGLTATSGSGGVQLNWTAPTVSGITGYEVYYTPTIHTMFGATPIATVAPGATSTTIANGKPGVYALSTETASGLTLYNSVAAPAPLDPNAAIALSPTSSTPSGTVKVSGTGFGKGAVKVYVTDTSGPAVGSAKASAAGSFTVSIPVKSITAGPNLVLAVGKDGTTVGAVLTGVAQVTLNPTKAAPATKDVATLAGFPADVRVTLTLGSSPATPLGTVYTSPSGAAKMTFTVPKEKAGNYNITAQGADSNETTAIKVLKVT